MSRGRLFSAIRHGRSFATTGPSIRKTVNGKMMGETAVVRTFKNEVVEISLEINAESVNAVIVKIDIVKNGNVMETIEPMAPVFDETLIDTQIDGDCYYRVEVTTYDLATGKYQFAFSNPVFVRAIQ
ncbi:MAG: hypothetical protein JW793_07635 [Acidobacteria bacterium]|nr:hypothetical protein [Acidobacteriota bacterium]